MFGRDGTVGGFVSPGPFVRRGREGVTDVVAAGIRVQHVGHRNHALVEPAIFVLVFRTRVGRRVRAGEFQLKRVAHDDTAHPVRRVDKASNSIDRQVRRDLRVAE